MPACCHRPLVLSHQGLQAQVIKGIVKVVLARAEGSGGAQPEAAHQLSSLALDHIQLQESACGEVVPQAAPSFRCPLWERTVACSFFSWFTCPGITLQLHLRPSPVPSVAICHVSCFTLLSMLSITCGRSYPTPALLPPRALPPGLSSSHCLGPGSPPSDLELGEELVRDPHYSQQFCVL